MKPCDPLGWWLSMVTYLVAAVVFGRMAWRIERENRMLKILDEVAEPAPRLYNRTESMEPAKTEESR